MPREVLLSAQAIIHNEVVGGFTLLVAAMAALIWANSPWSEIYRQFQDATITMGAGSFAIEEDVKHWVNDGLMAIFFFVVGLEIKREVVHGELAGVRRAALPVAGALGGMIVPALIYLGFNIGGEGVRGWGIPMATDIAFALGVLALLGDRVPSQLKIFLLALAIIDDIGAILVIAVFYTEQLSWTALATAAMVLGLILAMLQGGMRTPLIYIVMGLLFWGAMLQSGVHATIAGVLLGVLTPARSWFSERTFADSAEAQLHRFRHALDEEDHEAAGAILGEIEELTRTTEAPLDRLERLIHPWVSYLVLPLFALVNAGVTFSGDMLKEAMVSPVTFGVLVGLMIGKTAGVTAFSWVAVRLGLAEFSGDLTWAQMAAIAPLSAIGFTVALFITELAFTEGTLADQAKVGILAASLFAGVIGYVTLRLALQRSNPTAETSDSTPRELHEDR